MLSKNISSLNLIMHDSNLNQSISQITTAICTQHKYAIKVEQNITYINSSSRRQKVIVFDAYCISSSLSMYKEFIMTYDIQHTTNNELFNGKYIPKSLQSQSIILQNQVVILCHDIAQTITNLKNLNILFFFLYNNKIFRFH